MLFEIHEILVEFFDDLCIFDDLSLVDLEFLVDVLDLLIFILLKMIFTSMKLVRCTGTLGPYIDGSSRPDIARSESRIASASSLRTSRRCQSSLDGSSRSASRSSWLDIR